MRLRINLICPLAFIGLLAARPPAVAAQELFGSDTNFDTNTLVRIDPFTASYQAVGPFNFNVQGLAYAPDLDQLFGLSAQTRRIYRIDRSTAATTALGTAPHTFGNANGLAFDSRRQRLIASSNADGGTVNRMFAIDPSTGQYTPLPDITGVNNVEGLGYDPATDTLYGVADVENVLVSIDMTTGAATTVAQLPALNWRGLDYDPSRRVFYASVSAGGDLYEISLAPTPSVRFIGFTSRGTQGLAVVPEPAVGGCMACAMLLLARPVRRRG